MIPSRPTPEKSRTSPPVRGVVMRDWPGRRRSAELELVAGSAAWDAVDDAADAAAEGLAEGGDAEQAPERAPGRARDCRRERCREGSRGCERVKSARGEGARPEATTRERTRAARTRRERTDLDDVRLICAGVGRRAVGSAGAEALLARGTIKGGSRRRPRGVAAAGRRRSGARTGSAAGDDARGARCRANRGGAVALRAPRRAGTAQGAATTDATTIFVEIGMRGREGRRRARLAAQVARGGGPLGARALGCRRQKRAAPTALFPD